VSEACSETTTENFARCIILVKWEGNAAGSPESKKIRLHFLIIVIWLFLVLRDMSDYPKDKNNVAN
jgi:hypothetical protein